MSDEQLISFKDMCARFDVTPRTLRYYEYIELLRPFKEGRARFYGPREIARMTLILRGRRFGTYSFLSKASTRGLAGNGGSTTGRAGPTDFRIANGARRS